MKLSNFVNKVSRWLYKYSLLIIISTLNITISKAAVVAAGASLPAALYTQWSYSFNQKEKIQVNYQSVGSSSGFRQVRDRIVDFGASDKPISKTDLEKHKLIQIPTVSTGLVIVANLGEDIRSDIVLDKPTIYKIWTNQITFWDDPEIQKLNPDVKLPHIYIALIYRADGSGTTYNYTSFLAKVNPEFKKTVGVGNNVNWGKGISAKGNEGIAFMVPRIKGAIGYLEYGFSKEVGLLPIRIQNQDGSIVTASEESIKTAVLEGDWSNPAVTPDLLKVTGNTAWPIALVTFILIPQEMRPATPEVLKFLSYGLVSSQAETASLNFVPLNTELAKQLVGSLYDHFKLPGKP